MMITTPQVRLPAPPSRHTHLLAGCDSAVQGRCPAHTTCKVVPGRLHSGQEHSPARCSHGEVVCLAERSELAVGRYPSMMQSLFLLCVLFETPVCWTLPCQVADEEKPIISELLHKGVVQRSLMIRGSRYRGGATVSDKGGSYLLSDLLDNNSSSRLYLHSLAFHLCTHVATHSSSQFSQCLLPNAALCQGWMVPCCYVGTC